MPLTVASGLISPWFPLTGAPAEETLRLVCFPHAGGTPSLFRGWEERLGDDVRVVPVLLPGRGLRLRERPYETMEPLAADIADALTEHGLTGHGTGGYAMFGHSMGALLAYEVACALRERGEPEPRHLFVSGSRAPHLYGDRADHRLPDEALLGVVRDLGGLEGSEAVGGAYLERRLPVLRADLSACENYQWRPRPPLGCPMTAFSATDDPIATPVQVEAWREYTAGSLLRRHLPGDHFYLNGASRDRLLRELRGELGRLRAHHGTDQDAPTRHPIPRRTSSWTS